MVTRQKILFYGNSLMLSGIRASMQTCSWLDVIALNGTATEAELLASCPNVVIFDMGAIQPEFLLTRLQTLPGLLLIGIDPESHEVLLTGQAAGSISVEQIEQLVRIQESDPAYRSGESAEPEKFTF